ncbi:unnamed protein product [Protopolystoma xenopodis]|uniref:Uncharacterized protein n=1 Tax=Protopolystoma xenopodis TaxID=117903 RepID=A0A448XH29_9PLAT|nr:unnamed protein product [Protopolystoma xenopodis]
MSDGRMLIEDLVICQDARTMATKASATMKSHLPVDGAFYACGDFAFDNGSNATFGSIKEDNKESWHMRRFHDLFKSTSRWQLRQSNFGNSAPIRQRPNSLDPHTYPSTIRPTMVTSEAEAENQNGSNRLQITDDKTLTECMMKPVSTHSNCARSRGRHRFTMRRQKRSEYEEPLDPFVTNGDSISQQDGLQGTSCYGIGPEPCLPESTKVSNLTKSAVSKLPEACFPNS